MIYMQELQDIQNSLSWRITKPLRLMKKVALVWRQDGFFTVLRKACNKLKR